jgi:hypothetical protein
LHEIQQNLPDFDWARYPRSITTPKQPIGKEIWKWVERRIRNPCPTIDHSDASVEDDLAAAATELAEIGETTRQALIAARRGQGFFRDRLLSYWNGACAVTGCGIPVALRASHIKTWRDSLNEERLDPFNGLLLAGTIDLLFDCGLISFSDKGALLLSSHLPKREHQRLGLRPGQRLRRLSTRHKPYLKWHREHTFLGVA